MMLSLLLSVVCQPFVIFALALFLRTMRYDEDNCIVNPLMYF